MKVSDLHTYIKVLHELVRTKKKKDKIYILYIKKADENREQSKYVQKQLTGTIIDSNSQLN